MEDSRTFAELAVVAGYEVSEDVSSALQPEDHEAVRVIDPHCLDEQVPPTQVATAALHVAPEEDERLDFFVKKDGLEFAGIHLLIDLSGATRLDDLETVEAALRESAIVSGATILNVDSAPFRAEWRNFRCCRVVGEPYLHPHVAGAGFCGAGHLHVR